MTPYEKLSTPLNERRQIEKKVLPGFYKEVRTHRKTFEIRKDEDGIDVGDILVLREWDGEKYTGSMTRREVTYVLRDAEEYGLMKGYCIIGMHGVGWNWLRPQVVLDKESETARNMAIEALRKNETHKLSNREWKEFLAEQFGISKASAKEMLHGMMVWKKEDNFKRLFDPMNNDHGERKE